MKQPSPTPKLPSHQEVQLFALLILGHSYKQMADTLHIAEGTVRQEMHHLLHKFDCASNVMLVGYAPSLGFTWNWELQEVYYLGVLVGYE